MRRFLRPFCVTGMNIYSWTGSRQQLHGRHLKSKTLCEGTKTASLTNACTATIALVVAALLLLPRSGFAQSTPYLDTTVGVSPPQLNNEQTSTTAAYLSDELHGDYGTARGNVRYGSTTVSGTTGVPATGNGGTVISDFRSIWQDYFTVNNPTLTGQSGVARFTLHLTGELTGSWTGSGSGVNQYEVLVGGNQQTNINGGIDNTGPFGTPPSTLATFTKDIPFQYGSTFALYFSLRNTHQVRTGGNANPGSVSTSADLTLSAGGFTVLDAQNQPVDFTLESHTGSARGSNIAPGGSFTEFTLTNNAPGRLGTTMSLRDGTASAATNVMAAFVAPPPPAVIQLASDAVDLSGTGTDLVVIQINYDPATAKTLFGGEAGLRLGCELKGWFNAISGNTGGTSQFFPRAYNAATDFHLGNFGLDTARHFVWAVVNHNSKYGVTVVADPAGTVTPPAQPLNISTRMLVLGGDQVLIGGFIITGNDPKKVIIRGIGPSLNGVGGTLANPTLELHQGNTTLVTNDNWKTRSDGSSQQEEIEATTIPPTNDLESAIVVTLNPGAYTAILAGKNGGTGVGLVEVYDLAPGANSKLANISTRGFVDTGNNVMIGGLIVGGASGNGTSKVIVRALGPSVPVGGALGDPTLELHDGSGTAVATNDNWKIDDQTGQSQEADIRATTIPPTNDAESALIASLAPGNYTAIVRGKNNATGVGLVEVYNLQ